MWEHAGIICTGETYKTDVKLTFAKGASLEDPSGLFNSSLEGNTRRAIDIHEGDKIDEKALKALIRAAVALNTSAASRRPAAPGQDQRALERACRPANDGSDKKMWRQRLISPAALDRRTDRVRQPIPSPKSVQCMPC